MGNIVIAVGAAIVMFLSAYLGVHVTLHPAESDRARWGYKIGFWLCGLVSVVLIGVQTYRNNASETTLREKLDQIDRNTKDPAKIEVTNNLPPPQIILTPQPTGRAIKERARLHIFDFQILLDDKDRITVNVYVQNVGILGAEMRTYHASALIVRAEDGEAERRLEAEAEKQMADTIQDLQRRKLGTPVHMVTPGPPGIWFTHQPMIKLTDDQYTDFKTQKKMTVFFSGLIEYSDDNGSHKTYYCVSSEGNPKVTFQCGTNREL